MDLIPSIHTFQFATASNPSMNLTRNSLGNGSGHNTHDFSDQGSQMYSIGEVPNSNHDFVGTVAEAITFSTNITVAERNRAESYLAIKYGITLGTPANPANYTSSDGTAIWTGNANYQRNVIGIGRDDTSELLQKQSRQIDDSVRIYKGTLEASNLENTSVFMNDRSFVVMGSNNGQLYATDASNLEVPSCGLYSRLEREWKVTRTNMEEDFNVYIKIGANGFPFQVDEAHLRLLVNTSADFSDGNAQCYSNLDGIQFVHHATTGAIGVEGINTTHIPNNSTRYFTIGSVSSETPLPVGLSDFYAECARTNVDLFWETKTETNNDYFTLEKSMDGYHFETLAIVNGKGNKTTTSQYTHTDYTSNVGVSYYRLSQTDFDGKETVLKTVSTNCEGDLEVLIYPNPTNDGVFFTLNGKSELGVDLVVYSITGQQLSQHLVKGSTWIQLPKESGLYLIKYVLNGEEKVEKVVKY